MFQWGKLPVFVVFIAEAYGCGWASNSIHFRDKTHNVEIEFLFNLFSSSLENTATIAIERALRLDHPIIYNLIFFEEVLLLAQSKRILLWMIYSILSVLWNFWLVNRKIYCNLPSSFSGYFAKIYIGYIIEYYARKVWFDLQK